MPDRLTLALDLGTTAAKGALFNERGERVAFVRVPLRLGFLPGGGVEQDAEAFVSSARRVLERIASFAPRSATIRSAGIACQRSTLVVWDRSTGKPCGPAVSWMDRRAAVLVEKWSGAAGDVARRTGLRLSPHYGAAHLARRLREEPALARAARRGELAAGPVASFVLSRLRGESLSRSSKALASDPSRGGPDACLCDPTLAQRMLLFDPCRGKWDQRLLDLFGIPLACLPTVQASASRFGWVPLGGHLVPVHALCGDQQAAAAAFSLEGNPRRVLAQYGTGAFVLWPLGGGDRDRRAGGGGNDGAARSLSSTGALGTRSAASRQVAVSSRERDISRDAPARRPHGTGRSKLLATLRADAPGAFYAEGTLNTAGAALDVVGGWIGRSRLRAILAGRASDGAREHGEGGRGRGGRAREHSDRAGALSDGGSAIRADAPLLVPAFAGLGAPHWDDRARAVLFGASGASTAADLVDAALAGIAHAVTDILEAGRRTLGPKSPIIASGPLTSLPRLLRIQADVAGRTVRVAREPEATLRGVARISAAAAGGPRFAAVTIGETVRPRIPAPERQDLRRAWGRAVRAARVR